MFFLVTKGQFNRFKERTMAAIDDLNANLVALAVDVDAVKIKLDELKATAGVPEAQVQAAADKAAELHAALVAAIQ